MSILALAGGRNRPRILDIAFNHRNTGRRCALRTSPFVGSRIGNSLLSSSFVMPRTVPLHASKILVSAEGSTGQWSSSNHLCVTVGDRGAAVPHNEREVDRRTCSGLIGDFLAGASIGDVHRGERDGSHSKANDAAAEAFGMF